MKSQNLISDNTFQTSSKRKEDVTIAELKTLPWFASHSDDELTKIIEATKIFARAVVNIHTKETANKRTSKKTINLITNQQKKAA